MNKQEILSKLKALDGKLPYEALKAAIAQRETIIPELLQIIEQATENMESLLDEPDYMGHIYAIYLLAQFREKSAYPVIVNFFSGSPGIVADITDNLIDKLGRVLASVCGGDDGLMKSLIENEAADEYARGEAVAGLVNLVAQGHKSRDEVIAYFQTLFRGKLKRDGENRVWDNLVTHATLLYPEELYEDIKQAYADKLVSPLFISLERVDIQLAVAKERVLKRFPLKYQLIDDAIQEIEKCIYFSDTPEHKQIREVMIDLTVNAGFFPRKALTKAVALREQITPNLLLSLEGAEENAHKILEREDIMWHIYPLYLLAQFREKRAYPLMVNFFSLPGEISLEITGDVVTEDLPRMLACVYDGDDTLLQELIEDTKVNEYVRNAALKAYIVLVLNGQKSREDVMAYYQSLFRGKLERQLSHIWGGLISCSLDLYPEEVYEDIQQAYTDNLVEEFYVGFKEVQEVYALGMEKALARLQHNHHYTLIDDTISELQNWGCFQPTKPPKRTQPPPAPTLPKPKKEKSAPRYSEPRKSPKIGRNEPCPCGSGKKYKKCCGA